MRETCDTHFPSTHKRTSHLTLPHSLSVSVSLERTHFNDYEGDEALTLVVVFIIKVDVTIVAAAVVAATSLSLTLLLPL